MQQSPPLITKNVWANFSDQLHEKSSWEINKIHGATLLNVDRWSRKICAQKCSSIRHKITKVTNIFRRGLATPGLLLPEKFYKMHFLRSPWIHDQNLEHLRMKNMTYEWGLAKSITHENKARHFRQAPLQTATNTNHTNTGRWASLVWNFTPNCFAHHLLPFSRSFQEDASFSQNMKTRSIKLAPQLDEAWLGQNVRSAGRQNCVNIRVVFNQLVPN